jgi:hypothetical protein
MKVVLVSTGVFQDYILDNIKNLTLHNNTDITVITEKEHFHKITNPNVQLVDTSELISDKIKQFDQTSTLDREFRGGFWYYCSLRFFYIYEYMKKYGVTDVVHLENDVMVYENLNKLRSSFKKRDKVYAPFDTYTRVIPSFLFIPNHTALKPIVDKYDGTKTDMDNLAMFEEVEPLPIIPIIYNLHKFNQNYEDFDAIFDAAALGQYVGGIDPRNRPDDTRGYINETCLFQFHYYPFYWLKNKSDNLWCPWVEINGRLVKIINLHLHCKHLNRFMSDNPIECKYIRRLP